MAGSPVTVWATLQVTNQLTLDDNNQLRPMLGAGALDLGGLDASNVMNSWRKIFRDYTNSGASGNQVINKPVGSLSIAAGASSVVVTNNLVTAASLVHAWLMQTDATLTFLRAIIPANGSFTINGNANATANCKVGFEVISTDA